MVPSTLTNLTNLRFLELDKNEELRNHPTKNLYGSYEVHAYLLAFFRHPAIRLLSYSLATTKKRQDKISTNTTATSPGTPSHLVSLPLAEKLHRAEELLRQHGFHVYTVSPPRRPSPTRAGNITTLLRLELNNCNFSGAVPSSFAKLRNLERLSLEENGFTTDTSTIPIQNDHSRD